jgi:hypothetical protein
MSGNWSIGQAGEKRSDGALRGEKKTVKMHEAPSPFQKLELRN